MIGYVDDKIRLEFNGSCLKQTQIQYTHRTIVNIYIFDELGASDSNDSDPTLKNCLFGTVTLTKNADIDKYKYRLDLLVIFMILLLVMMLLLLMILKVFIGIW